MNLNLNSRGVICWLGVGRPRLPFRLRIVPDERRLGTSGRREREH